MLELHHDIGLRHELAEGRLDDLRRSARSGRPGPVRRGIGTAFIRIGLSLSAGSASASADADPESFALGRPR